MRQRVEAAKEFEIINKAGDCNGLLISLKAISSQLQEGQKYIPLTIQAALKRYCNCAQGKFSATQAYLLDHFQITFLDVFLHCKATASEHPGIKDLVLAERKAACNTSNKELAKVKAKVFAQSTAIVFLTGCNRGGGGILLDDLKNNFLQGDNSCPHTGVCAYKLVTNWKASSMDPLLTVWHFLTSTGTSVPSPVTNVKRKDITPQTVLNVEARAATTKSSANRNYAPHVCSRPW